MTAIISFFALFFIISFASAAPPATDDLLRGPKRPKLEHYQPDSIFSAGTFLDSVRICGCSESTYLSNSIRHVFSSNFAGEEEHYRNTLSLSTIERLLLCLRALSLKWELYKVDFNDRCLNVPLVPENWYSQYRFRVVEHDTVMKSLKRIGSTGGVENLCFYGFGSENLGDMVRALQAATFAGARRLTLVGHFAHLADALIFVRSTFTTKELSLSSLNDYTDSRVMDSISHLESLNSFKPMFTFPNYTHSEAAWKNLLHLSSITMSPEISEYVASNFTQLRHITVYYTSTRFQLAFLSSPIQHSLESIEIIEDEHSSLDYAGVFHVLDANLHSLKSISFILRHQSHRQSNFQEYLADFIRRSTVLEEIRLDTSALFQNTSSSAHWSLWFLSDGIRRLKRVTLSMHFTIEMMRSVMSLLSRSKTLEELRLHMYPTEDWGFDHFMRAFRLLEETMSYDVGLKFGRIDIHTRIKFVTERAEKDKKERFIKFCYKFWLAWRMIVKNRSRDIIFNGKSVLGMYFDVDDCSLVDGFDFERDYVSIGQLGAVW